MADTPTPEHEPGDVLSQIERHLASIKQAAWWALFVLAAIAILLAVFVFGGGGAVVELKNSASSF